MEEKVKVVTAAGHDMILEVDEEGNVLVGGVKLMLRDKMTTNGVIHVIGKMECSPLESFRVLHAPAILSIESPYKERGDLMP